MSTVEADLAGRVAVISGAGSGIGEGLARHAASRLGMHVVVSDVAPERGEMVASAIRAAGGSAMALAADVADWDSVSQLAESVEFAIGSPALLVCNAGVEMTGLLWETAPQHWSRIQEINVNGAFHLMRAFLPGMLAREQRGHVLCTSSVGGIAIGASQSAYTVSKHGIRVLAQTLAADLASVQANVGVSVLLPGPVKTRIFQDAVTTGSSAAEEYRARLGAHLAEDGLTPADVARLTFDQITSGAMWIHPDADMSRRFLDAMVADLESGLG